MGVAERKLRHKEQVKAAILEEAWQIATTEGWQTLSIRKIADAIEYSIPVIYTHFENKEAILFEFTRKGFSILSEQLKEAKESRQESCQQLDAIAKAYFKFAFGNKAYYQLMFGLGMPPCETVSRVAEMKEFTDVIISVIQTAIKNSKNPDSDAFLKFHAYWSMLHGQVSLQMMNNNGTVSNDLKEKILEDSIASFIKALVS